MLQLQEKLNQGLAEATMHNKSKYRCVPDWKRGMKIYGRAPPPERSLSVVSL